MVSCTINSWSSERSGRFFASDVRDKRLEIADMRRPFLDFYPLPTFGITVPIFIKAQPQPRADPAVQVSRCRESRRPPTVSIHPATLLPRQIRWSPLRRDISKMAAVLSCAQGKALSKFLGERCHAIGAAQQRDDNVDKMGRENEHDTAFALAAGIPPRP